MLLTQLLLLELFFGPIHNFMARDYFINGETLVTVDDQELGFTDQQIKIHPRFYHQDLHCDDYGDQVPPDVMAMLAEAWIDMTLVHFDPAIVDYAIRFSMGGASTAGLVAGAGTIMGGATDRGNFMKLKLASPVGGKPWTFECAYLAESPVEFPIGTERSLVVLKWRAIPFWNFTGASVVDIKSNGITIWSNT